MTVAIRPQDFSDERLQAFYREHVGPTGDGDLSRPDLTTETASHMNTEQREAFLIEEGRPDPADVPEADREVVHIPAEDDR